MSSSVLSLAARCPRLHFPPASFAQSEFGLQVPVGQLPGAYAGGVGKR